MAKRIFNKAGKRLRKELDGPRAYKLRLLRKADAWDISRIGERTRPVVLQPETTAPIAAATWDEQRLIVVHEDGTVQQEWVRIRPRRVLRRLQAA